MDPRRLRFLVELSRRGTMRAVGEATGYATSAVSQQLAVLEREAGVKLLERVGRTVRLTAAGTRLVAHAERILAAMEVARADLDEGAEPAGVLRIATFASAMSTVLLPVIRDLAGSHPRLQPELQEREPDEALALLRDDAVDLALTYDYNLAPRADPPGMTVRLLWRTRWALAVPAGVRLPRRARHPQIMDAVRSRPWIANSRGPDDEAAIATLGALAGLRPRIGHRADSLDLVGELVAAGLGVGLLPASFRRPGIRMLPLTEPPVDRRVYAVVRAGRERWGPLALLIERVAASHSGSAAAGIGRA